ncbi:MAG: thioredoxin family protein [Phycisphaerales bacterium]|nr:thioredoxin family protein [Phycisphaerales bacterium]
MQRTMRLTALALAAAVLAVAFAPSPASAAAPAAARKPGGAADGKVAAKPPAWTDRFLIAQKRAQKEEKPMLLYFCSSDRDDFTKKLDAEVLNTPLWADWANATFVLVKVDFILDTKRQPPDVRNQNADLKTRFNVAKVPTFIFLDPWGELLARCGYGTAALRDDEAEGQPKRWLEYGQAVVASRPAKEKLQEQPDLSTAVAQAKKTAVPVCLVVNQAATNKQAATLKDALLGNQLFVRWMNRNMGLVQVAWPEEADKTPKAQTIRDFAGRWKFGPAALQLVIWDPGGLGQVKAMIGAIDPVDCAPLVKRLEPLLPSIDYNGGQWLDNWKVARAVSAQLQKDLLVSFVSTDGSEFSKRMEADIYQHADFKNYARANLVLLRVDFPAEPANVAKQTKDMKEQNEMLADMFGVRGYPTVVVLNPKGQKILDGKYMKGGGPVFVSEMQKQIRADKDRRTLISQEASKDMEKSK